MKYRVKERERRRYKGRKGGNILFTLTLTSIVEYLKRERGFLHIRHGTSFGDLSLKHFHTLSLPCTSTKLQTEISSLSTRILTHKDTNIDTYTDIRRHTHSLTHKQTKIYTHRHLIAHSFYLSISNFPLIDS